MIDRSRDPLLIRELEIIAQVGDDEEARNRRLLWQVAVREFISGPTFVDVLLSRDHLLNHIFHTEGETEEEEKEQLIVNAKLAIPRILDEEGTILRASKLPQQDLEAGWNNLLDICAPLSPDALLIDPNTIERAAEEINKMKDLIYLASDRRLTREGVESVLHDNPYNIKIGHQDLTRLLVFEINVVSRYPKIIGISRQPKPYNPLYALFKKNVDCSDATLNLLQLFSI